MTTAKASGVVCLSGNIASGKTTLGRALADQTGWVFQPEDSPTWPLMAELFENPRKYGLPAQLLFLSSKAARVLSADLGKCTLIDRSIYEDGEVFAALFHQQGWMTHAAWQAYQAVYDEVIRTVPIPRLIIFCACDPEVCRARLAHRDRPFDRKLPAAQIARVHEQYAAWLMGFDRCPIYEIDTARHDATDRAVAAEIAQEIKTILDSTVRPRLRLGALRRRRRET